MSTKDLPKSQLDSQPLWQTAVDAMLREEVDEAKDAEAPSHDQDWLLGVLSEYGASPPVELVAEHYSELGEPQQEELFAQLNDSCGYGYASEVVIQARKKRGVEQSEQKRGDGSTG